MYCVKCGVKLADTEKQCPLCQTDTSVWQLPRPETDPLYPGDRIPKPPLRSGVVNGTILFLFCIPLLLTFLVDLQANRKMEWFFYVAGALVVLYVTVALPLWFRRVNPVIFVPCDFAALALYLLLIERMTGGSWFLPFALPVTGGIGLIVTAVVTLLRYLKKGRLYVFGGAGIALGAMLLLVEFLMGVSFGFRFSGWSMYPLVILGLLGGMLIFLGINKTAREKMERRFFL